MKNKINIAELLKDCPKGTKLYSPIFGEVYLDKIRPHLAIVVTDNDKELGDFREEFLYDGRYGMNGECMLFPSKYKTTWEGFVPPCTFKDGDIIFTHANCLKVGLGNTWISIYQENRNGGVATYIDYAEDGSDYYSNIDEDKPLLCMEKDIMRQRLATEEEKQKLFDAIKDRGYKWNAETKTLEKLVEPKFKVWDRIRHKYDQFRDERTIVSCGKCGYWTSINAWIDYENQDEWELVHDKFNIKTLKPFDKVLVREFDDQMWTADMFSFYNEKNIYPFACVGHYVNQCIPYEGNEHLLGTSNDCDNYYKTWE
jgi:hypothetical protein